VKTGSRLRWWTRICRWSHFSVSICPDTSGHYWTGSSHDRTTAARFERNGVWQTMKGATAATSRQYWISSTPAHWTYLTLVVYSVYTFQTRPLSIGGRITVPTRILRQQRVANHEIGSVGRGRSNFLLNDLHRLKYAWHLRLRLHQTTLQLWHLNVISTTTSQKQLPGSQSKTNRDQNLTRVSQSEHFYGTLHTVDAHSQSSTFYVLAKILT